LQKIIFILGILFFSVACAVTKKESRSRTEIVEEDKDSLLFNLFKRNLSIEDFNILKLEIEFNYQNKKQLFLASVKFNKPDKFLISVRSKSGIEALRIYISRDTILVNDRINRRLYRGSPDYLKIKYGFTSSLIPVIFGDFLGDINSGNQKADCINGNVVVDYIIDGIKIKSEINCEYKKIISTSITASYENKDIVINFTDFVKFDKVLLPREILMKGLDEYGLIRMKIKSVEYPWTGEIEFVPGNKYKIMNLL
jgi:hypothetical protein